MTFFISFNTHWSRKFEMSELTFSGASSWTQWDTPSRSSNRPSLRIELLCELYEPTEPEIGLSKLGNYQLLELIDSYLKNYQSLVHIKTSEPEVGVSKLGSSHREGRVGCAEDLKGAHLGDNYCHCAPGRSLSSW